MSPPIRKSFRDFDAELKAAMRRETELFAETIIREDRSVLDFLGGRLRFVNERLAKHYGIDGVSGAEFRRVNSADKRRSGVLTQASVLTLTSNPARTSPVKRGKWMLENILGSPPPDPPPDAPDLEAVQKAKPNASLRQQLEMHRENAVCASCHQTMDHSALAWRTSTPSALARQRRQFCHRCFGRTAGRGEVQGAAAELMRCSDKTADRVCPLPGRKDAYFRPGTGTCGAGPLCGR